MFDWLHAAALFQFIANYTPLFDTAHSELLSLLLKKVNPSRYRPEVPREFQEVKVPRLRDNGTGWWQGCQPYAPADFNPQEMLLVLISVGG